MWKTSQLKKSLQVRWCTKKSRSMKDKYLKYVFILIIWIIWLCWSVRHFVHVLIKSSLMCHAGYIMKSKKYMSTWNICLGHTQEVLIFLFMFDLTISGLYIFSSVAKHLKINLYILHVSKQLFLYSIVFLLSACVSICFIPYV
jgi:hypothetical protein